MKKILIPIHLNHHNCDAIDYAVKFFKREVCEFYFLNTYNYNVQGLNAIQLLQADEDWFERPKQESQERLSRLIKKYSYNNRNKNHGFNAISECTGLISGIKKNITELAIDIVVVSCKDKLNRDVNMYCKSTSLIIDEIRECPILIMPTATKQKRNPVFALVSDFKSEVSEEEIESWYEIVKLSNGTLKIVVSNSMNEMTNQQISNQTKVCYYLRTLTNSSVVVDYLNTTSDIKEFANTHSNHIISLIDKKPDFLRKYGLGHSTITNLGPLSSSPLIALHQ
ncbi:hypothetical protein JM84_1363 [Dokdonia sp. Hel_I_63]|jgi:hypothetical protein|uniref:hypothetical protein n=1 Tax=Dokdonia sp. Hel_I_63 TaxID=1249996 RepID=UPI00119A07D3|nr:hypothetical protein [Dokdonia sp. Hel_I_63]TVZ22463.1 hypothetical protein JM84_1363 [Dokdonia sp. Hel_I_63]